MSDYMVTIMPSDSSKPCTFNGNPKSRDTVTMNKPLEPWGHTRFHKFLAIHMHNATRLAGDNDGLVDDVETAQKWDLATVVQ